MSEQQRLEAMARRIARGYVQRCPVNVRPDDLFQAARIGLWDAQRRHPERTGPEWDGYVAMRVRGEIIDELRAQDYAPRRARLGNAHLRVVGFDDVCDDWSDRIAGKSEDPEQAAIARVDAAKAWAAPMRQGDRTVLKRRYEGGWQQAHVAAAEGVSCAWVSQRESRGLLKMREHLEER